MSIDNQEFTSMHNRLYNRVYSYLSFRINDSEEVKDLVQEVFLKAFRTWDVIPDEKVAMSYLYVIARSKSIDFFRSARHKYLGFLPGNSHDEFTDTSPNDQNQFDSVKSDLPLPEDIFIKNENNKMVMEMLNILEPLERELVSLRFLSELEYSELSKIYNTTEDNVRKKISRALAKVRKNTKVEPEKKYEIRKI